MTVGGEPEVHLDLIRALSPKIYAADYGAITSCRAAIAVRQDSAQSLRQGSSRNSKRAVPDLIDRRRFRRCAAIYFIAASYILATYSQLTR